MSPTEHNSGPTPYDLAGIPAEVEDREETTAQETGGNRTRSIPHPGTAPGPEVLAGIPVLVEGNEDNTVRPRRKGSPRTKAD
jgi:hypothetical protein